MNDWDAVDEEDNDTTTADDRPMLAKLLPAVSSNSSPSPSRSSEAVEKGMVITTPTQNSIYNPSQLSQSQSNPYHVAPSQLTDTIPPFTSKSPVAKSPLTLSEQLQFESESESERLTTSHTMTMVPEAVLFPAAVQVTTLLLPAFAGDRTIHVASMNGAKVRAV